ncbi:ATPase inhibitor A, mitochondrial-like [Planococcus citri]|uniref:ATPase inhibitor A, mitochondrial-like n=1 Tax=Planococcus citri TaxID=170843 RepID=UPI0031F9A299
MNQLKSLNRLVSQRGIFMSASQFSSELGSGAGKGGGGGGTIREAGGSFGKREAAAEEQYFRKLQADQLHQLKDHMSDEISFHEDQIKRHQEALEKAKKSFADLEKAKK